MTGVVIARVLHVLGVVIWIGGVSMATTVALPAVRHSDFGENRLRAFKAIERRFVWQARSALILVGLTGFYLMWRLDLWDRFRLVGFWWMHAMVGVWLLYAFVLFVAEPFILQRHFDRWAVARPRATFAWLHRVHWVLLLLSMVTILGCCCRQSGAVIVLKPRDAPNEDGGNER
jgi:uncharacterized membrane protein